MNAEKLRGISDTISAEVHRMHQDRKSWNKLCGQWLVYGFEAKLGFAEAISLESVVENAWKTKQDISQAVFEYLKEFYVEAGKWEELDE